VVASQQLFEAVTKYQAGGYRKMKFAPMTKPAIEEALTAIEYDVLVTLTDGTTLFGCKLRYDPERECLALWLNATITVPLRDIAGVRPVSWLSEPVLDSTYPYRIHHRGVGSIWFRDSTSIAYQKRYPVFWPHACPLRKPGPSEPARRPETTDKIEEPIGFGRIAFDSFQELYSDWDHLTRTTPTLNELGISLVGVSVSFRQNLMSRFRKVFRPRDIIALKSLGPNHEAQDTTLKGVVTFFEKRIFHEIEGNEWELGALTEEWQDNRTALEGVNWLPVYFRRDRFMFPREAWERITSPFLIVGSLQKTSLKTWFGEKGLHLLARFAAFVPEHSPKWSQKWLRWKRPHENE